MNHITLVVEIETRFDLRFDVGEIEEIKSIGELVRMIADKRALAPA